MVKNHAYEETELHIQNTIINGKAYIPFKFMNNIYPIDDIISHQGKLYIRPLSLRELSELNALIYLEG